MKFEEPQVQFIRVSYANVVYASPTCQCVDGSAGSSESCNGLQSFSDGGCEDFAPLIA